jgi:restriction endonuclease S subunit
MRIVRIPVIQKKNHNNKAEKIRKKMSMKSYYLKKDRGKNLHLVNKMSQSRNTFFSGQTSDRSGCPTMS